MIPLKMRRLFFGFTPRRLLGINGSILAHCPSLNQNKFARICWPPIRLRAENQGTVHVDLMRRRLTFSPTVSPDVRGATVGMGMTATSLGEAEKEAPHLLSPTELAQATTPERKAELISIKKSVLEALGVPKSEASYFGKLDVTLLGENRISVKALGEVSTAYSLPSDRVTTIMSQLENI